MHRRIAAARLVSRLLPLAPAAALGQPASPPAAPPAVYSVGAAYDDARGRLVVFGGYRAGQYVGDTWEWDGARWTRDSLPGPSARNGPALVYDAKRGRVLLFGGDARPTGEMGDSWERVDGRWRQLAIPGPPPRTGHVLAYDARRDRVVLFGGVAHGEGLGDTWELDGERWTRVATDGPPLRGLHAMAYDAARGRTVLFGGTPAPVPNASPLGDTWEWDGRRWTRAEVAGPSARDHTQMAYDPARRRVVLHGGGAAAPDAAETWLYDGRAWTRAALAGPPRRYAKMAFDPRAGAVLLYGGFAEQPSNELWRLDEAGWRRVSP